MNSSVCSSFVQTNAYCVDQVDRSAVTLRNLKQAFIILFQGSHYLSTMRHVLSSLHKQEIWNKMTTDEYNNYKREISILQNSLDCLKDRQSFIIFNSVFRHHSFLIEGLIEEIENILENYELKHSALFASFQNAVNTEKIQYCCQ
jgi:hypothetical protein